MSSSASPNGSEAAQGNGTITAAEDFSVYLLNQVRFIDISCAEVGNCFTNEQLMQPPYLSADPMFFPPAPPGHLHRLHHTPRRGAQRPRHPQHLLQRVEGEQACHFAPSKKGCQK